MKTSPTDEKTHPSPDDVCQYRMKPIQIVNTTRHYRTTKRRTTSFDDSHKTSSNSKPHLPSTRVESIATQRNADSISLTHLLAHSLHRCSFHTRCTFGWWGRKGKLAVWVQVYVEEEEEEEFGRICDGNANVGCEPRRRFRGGADRAGLEKQRVKRAFGSCLDSVRFYPCRGSSESVWVFVRVFVFFGKKSFGGQGGETVMLRIVGGI